MSVQACTALEGPGSRCGRSPVVRDFCSAYYPEGPAIRLCRSHVSRYHRIAVEVASGHREPEALERIADDWRWAPDCERR